MLIQKITFTGQSTELVVSALELSLPQVDLTLSPSISDNIESDVVAICIEALLGSHT